MNRLKKSWNNFKAQPEIWFFYAFILTSPFSIRKVFFHYPLFGDFNEYAGVYLYLSDVIFGLTLGTWLLSILYNNLYILSINRSLTVSPQKESSTLIRMFPVEHPTGQPWNFLQDRRGTKIVLLGLPALLVLWSSITIFWSDQPQIALYRSFKLFEFYLLYLFLALNPKCSIWNILRNVFRIIIAAGLINAIIGISQVILQHSLGLFWLKESLISPDLPGIAKIVLNGNKYIRAYGLFPHANILGGFLLLSIILTLAYRQIFYSSEDNSRLRRVNQMFHGEHSKFLHNGVFFPLILGIQIVGGILTVSKSAILGLILALVYIYRHQVAKMFHPSTNVPRGTSYGAGMKHFGLLGNETLKITLLIAVTMGLGIYLIHPDFGSIFIKSMMERLVYIKISLSMISGNFLTGIGSGQFVLEMQEYSNQMLQAWQFQPVHNVFLLIWSELGLIGLSIFAWFIWKLFHPSTNVPRGTSYGTGVKQNETTPGLKNVPHGTSGLQYNFQGVFRALLIGFFAIVLFDHYLWDIQQGQIMLWTALGLLAGIKLRS